MVVAGTRRSMSGIGMDYSGANDLLRFGSHLAESRVDCAGSIAGNGNRTRMASLEGWNFTIKLCPRGHVNCRGPARLPSDFSCERQRLIFLPLRSSYSHEKLGLFFFDNYFWPTGFRAWRSHHCPTS